MLNKTREIYRKIIQSKKPTPEQLSQTVQDGKDLQNLLEHPGWKVLDRFISMNREGILATMERGIEPDRKKDKDRLRVYDDFQIELKTYNKIHTFISTVIANGKKHEERLRKEDEQK